MMILASLNYQHKSLLLYMFSHPSAVKDNFIFCLSPLSFLCIGAGVFGKYHYGLTYLFTQCVVIQYDHFSFWYQIVPNLACENPSFRWAARSFDMSPSISELFLLSGIKCSRILLPHVLESGISLRRIGSF